MVLKPHLVFERYLNGTRKKYTNPFTFFAIGTALSVFVLSFYSDELISISTKTSLSPSETIVDNYSNDGAKPEINKKRADLLEKQQAFNKSVVSFMFKHYNYLSFLFLPFYALIAMLVYGKPNNYGEHLVINAYIHGLLFLFGLLLFFATLLVRQDFYTGGSLLLTVLIYLYAYKKYKKHTIGETVVMLLKFIGIMLVLMILLVLIGVLIGRFVVK
jgi:hypothetical protein